MDVILNPNTFFFVFLGKPVALHDKVAALRSEKEGEARTPTPPPHLKAALG